VLFSDQTVVFKRGPISDPPIKASPQLDFLFVPPLKFFPHFSSYSLKSSLSIRYSIASRASFFLILIINEETLKCCLTLQLILQTKFIFSSSRPLMYTWPEVAWIFLVNMSKVVVFPALFEPHILILFYLYSVDFILSKDILIFIIWNTSRCIFTYTTSCFFNWAKFF